MKKMSLVLSMAALSITGVMLAACDDDKGDVVPVPVVSASASTVAPSSFCPSVSVSASPSVSVSVSVSPSDEKKNDVKGDGGVAYRAQPEPSQSWEAEPTPC